jgi:hypothetical protein
MLPITEKAKMHEWKNILKIAQKNCFPMNIVHDMKKKEITKQKNKQITTKEKQMNTNRTKMGNIHIT